MPSAAGCDCDPKAPAPSALARRPSGRESPCERTWVSAVRWFPAIQRVEGRACRLETRGRPTGLSAGSNQAVRGSVEPGIYANERASSPLGVRADGLREFTCRDGPQLDSSVRRIELIVDSVAATAADQGPTQPGRPGGQKMIHPPRPFAWKSYAAGRSSQQRRPPYKPSRRDSCLKYRFGTV